MSRIALAMVVFTACATNTPASSGITAADIACPADSNLTYENFGKSVIADNCLACHKADASPTLNTQAEVQANKDKIISAAVLGTSMPKSVNNMVADERQLLGEWLSCGAP